MSERGWDTYFGREVELDGVYYVFYSDEKKEVTQKEREEYDYLQILPDKIRYRELEKFDPGKDPNVMKIKGRLVMEMSDRGYIPVFDRFFEKTRRLTFIPVEGYQFYKEWSYMMKHKATRRGRPWEK